MLRLLLAFAASAGAFSSHPQQPSLIGSWNIEYEAGRRVENGTPTPIMGKATLSIAQSGDSLLATLSPAPRDGVAQPPATFGGRATKEGATFKQFVRARVNVNGEAQEVPLTVTWQLAAKGAALSGTLERSPLPGRPPFPPAPVTGTRA